MAHRPGFVIPNAGDTLAGNNRQAEPDAGDFSILGTENYGVLTGFDFAISGGMFNLNTVSNINVCLVAGAIYETPNIQAPLSAAGLQDRFDLVVYLPLTTDSNKLQIIKGTENNDSPKFADIPSNALVVAAVWVPTQLSGTGTSALTIANVVDKRRWVLHGGRGAADANNTFLENRIGGTDPTYKVWGSGQTRIGSPAGANVTLLPYEDAGPKFDITGGADSGGDITEVVFKTPRVTINGSLTVTGGVTAGGQVTGSNLLVADVPGTPSPDLGQTGSLLLDTEIGRAFVKMNTGAWAEIMKDEYPPGTVISTLLTGQAAADYLTGSWLQCNGQAVPAATYPKLAACFPQWVHGGVLTVPDLRNCFLGSGSVDATGFGGANTTHLTRDQLPPHTHLSAGSTSAAGRHNHGANNYSGPAGTHGHTMPLGGQHQHHITDVGHVHNGVDHGYNIPSPFVHMKWGGGFKVDTLNVDADHGPNVDFDYLTVPAATGINSTDNDGLHSHPLSAAPDHTHALNLAVEPDHTHPLPAENPVGSSADVDNRPRFFGVNWYIKT